jgi:hypothetical protein
MEEQSIDPARANSIFQFTNISRKGAWKILPTGWVYVLLHQSAVQVFVAEISPWLLHFQYLDE